MQSLISRSARGGSLTRRLMAKLQMRYYWMRAKSLLKARVRSQVHHTCNGTKFMTRWSAACLHVQLPLISNVPSASYQFVTCRTMCGQQCYICFCLTAFSMSACICSWASSALHSHTFSPLTYQFYVMFCIGCGDSMLIILAACLRACSD